MPASPLPVAARSVLDRLAFGPNEVADVLGISRAYCYALIKNGTIPSVKLGGRRLIRREALVALLAELEGQAG